MSIAYNLLIEPWIPVLSQEGQIELGLRDTLIKAHELQEIRDPLPIAEFGLYRLLVALVMDIFEIKTLSQLGNLISTGRFDPKTVDVYFNRYQDRFNLFDDDHPFLQSPNMDKEQERPLAGLLPSIPSGGAFNVFLHQNEQDFAVSPAVAARLLTTISPFMTAGGRGLSPSINGAPPWYVLLVSSKNLFETICLNCCAIPIRNCASTSLPAWRNPKPVECREYNEEVGLLEGLTWRPRRIKLIPGEQGTCSLTHTESAVLVRTMKFLAGASCRFSWCDPNVPYRNTDKGPMVLRPQEGREIWRDTGPMTFLSNEAYKSEDVKIEFERPTVINQFARLIDDRILDRRQKLSFIVYGMRTDMKMKVFEWQKERLNLPVNLILNGFAQREAQKAMEQAERVDSHLRKAIKYIYPRGGGGNKKAFDSIVNDARNQFWSDLRPEYDNLLEGLAAVTAEEEDKIQELHEDWHQDVVRIGWRAFDDAVGVLDADRKQLARQMEARRIFAAGLARVFANTTEKEGNNGK